VKRCLVAILTLAMLTTVVRAESPDRTRPPRPGAPPSLQMPTIVKRQLTNGIPVWFVRRTKVPLVSVGLLVRAGAMHDPVGRYGLASYTASCLDEGAGSRDALAFAEAVDMLGADLSASAGYDATLVTLEVPGRRLEPALDLMADLVLRPRFPQAELDRLRGQALTGFLQIRQDPASLVSAAFLSVLFGPNHRYGTPVAGQAVQFARLTRQDLVDFHRQAYRPELASLVVTGDAEPEVTLRMLQSRFGCWPVSGPALERAPTRAVPARERGVFLVDRPDSPQSLLRVGLVGVARSTPDYFPLQIANTMLGGSFTSRLNQNLRERNGYTYGASSGFAMRLEPGPFTVSTSVQADKTGAAVGEILSELQALARPAPQEELSKARNYCAYSFPGGFETCADLAGMVLDMQLHRLPDSYYSEYVGRLLAVDAPSAARAVSEVVDPQALAVVVVGDAALVRPQLEALGLGPVHLMSPDDFLGPSVPVPPARP